MLKTTAELLNNCLNEISLALMQNRLHDIPEIVRIMRETVKNSNPHQGSQMQDDSYIVLMVCREDIWLDPEEAAEKEEGDVKWLASKMSDNDSLMNAYWETIEYLKEELENDDAL